MPSKLATAAARLDDEDPDIATGDVYMDPQTIERDNEDDPRDKPADRDKKSKATKAPDFKARLIFAGQKKPIGQFRTTGTRVSCKIQMEELDNWSSSIRFTIKAFREKAAPTEDHTKESVLVKNWVFRLNVTSDCEAKPEIYSYPAAYFKKPTDDEDDYYEKAYLDYCVTVDDAGAITHRKGGRLAFVKFTFRPAKAQTEGILHDPRELGKFKYIQDQLLQIFTYPDDKQVEMGAFVSTSEIGSFLSAYNGILTAYKLERAHPPYTRWFGGLADAKPRIQKGTITVAADRPSVITPFNMTYPNSNECWTTEGMSVIYQQENELEDVKKSQLRDAQLRVLKTTPGGDRTYIGLLRLPSDYEYHFSPQDSFMIQFPTEEWSATILPKPFPYAHSVDYTIMLNRPWDNDSQKWSDLQLGSVFDLTDEENTSRKDLEQFCFHSVPIVIGITPLISDVPYKFKLAAIKTLNPANEKDKNHVHNPRWQRLIMGQDLRTTSTVNIFKGIDVEAKLQEWDVHLDNSQLAELKYLSTMPNNLGLIKGPWGTGKTGVDVVAAMLLISNNQMVKVVSPTNKAADTFAEKLSMQLARLQENGITITTKQVVRFHSPMTEQRVVRNESERYIEHDNSNARWQPSTGMLQVQYDRIAAALVDETRDLPFGIPDRRYKLNDMSFGTLLLRTAGLLGRSKPDPIPASDAPEKEELETDKTHPVSTTGESSDTERNDSQGDNHDDGPTPDTERNDSQGDNHDDGPTADTERNDSQGDNHDDGPTADTEHEELDDDNRSFDTDVSGEEGPEFGGAISKGAKQLQDEVREKTLRMLEEAGNTSERENLCQCFREMFCRLENGEKFESKEEYHTFKELERLLSIDILKKDVGVVVTTLVNLGHSIIKENFKGDHTIVQEGGKADNGELFIALAQCETTLQLSGDDVQLPPKEQDQKRNPFAKQSNKSLYKRWIELDYPKHELTEQHRTIPVITNAISKVWYRDSMTSAVDPNSRPNTAIAIAVHQQLYGKSTPLLWINTDGQSRKVGYSRSSQNERELQLAIKLCRNYIQGGIKASDILILAGYIAQVNLTKRSLPLDADLRDVDVGTIDGYQGEEKSAVILCMVGSEKLGFMSQPSRLLTGVSRAADALAIITNDAGIRGSENKRKRFCYDYLRTLLRKDDLYITSTEELADLDLIEHDYESDSNGTAEDPEPAEGGAPAAAEGGAPAATEGGAPGGEETGEWGTWS